MLIKVIDTLKGIIPTIASNDFTRYQSWLAGADRWLQRELIGNALYQVIDQPENDHEDLLKYAQSVSAFRAYLDAIPFLDLVETETGFGVVSQANNIVPASKERVQALIKQTEKSLSDACEDLLRYLEETPAYHADWKQSKAYSFISDCLIHSLDEFRRYANFPGNRLDFLNVKPIMLKIQKMNIEKYISRELVAEIITELRGSGGLSDPNKAIIDLLRFSLAFYTINDREFKKLIISNPYERKAEEAIDADKNGLAFLQEAQQIILGDLDNYPAFKNSALYTQLLANKEASNKDVTDSPFLVAGA